jgi:hypothetical protein
MVDKGNPKPQPKKKKLGAGISISGPSITSKVAAGVASPSQLFSAEAAAAE